MANIKRKHSRNRDSFLNEFLESTFHNFPDSPDGEKIIQLKAEKKILKRKLIDQDNAYSNQISQYNSKIEELGLNLEREVKSNKLNDQKL